MSKILSKSEQSFLPCQLIRMVKKGRGTFTQKSNRIDLDKKRIVIGSSDKCDVIIREPGVDPRNSVVLLEQKDAFVVDLDSHNGTLVNGKKIAHRQKINHMDKIQIGSVVFLFLNKEYPLDSILLEDYFDDQLPDVKPDYQHKLPTNTIIGMVPSTVHYNSEEDFIQIIDGIARGYSLPILLDRIMELVFKKFPADRGFVLMLDENRGEFIPVATRSRLREQEMRHLAISRTILKKVWKDREAVLISDIADLKPLGGASHSMLFHGSASIICVPLIFNNELLGVLQLDTVHPDNRFQKADLEKLLTYCRAAAIAIGNTNLREKIKEELQLREAMTKYLPHKLVDQVISGDIIIPSQGVEAEVAVLFADIRGFSEKAGRIPPQELIEILNEYYEEVSYSIFENSGMITQFVGDEIMALFGGPWVKDPSFSPADAGVSAAREVIRKICQMNVDRQKDNRESIFVGVGLDIGKVVMCNLGSSKKFEFTAIGNTVVKASRLCSHAKPSHILVTDNIIRNLKDKYSYEYYEDIKAKNVKDPIKTYRVHWNR